MDSYLAPHLSRHSKISPVANIIISSPPKGSSFRKESEVGTYERKQENKKIERKHALDQENDQEKRKFLDKKYQDNVEKIQQRSTA